MSSKPRRNRGAPVRSNKGADQQGPDVRRLPLLLGIGALAVASVSAIIFFARPSTASKISNADPTPTGPAREKYLPRPPGTINFNKDIAPIVYNRCSTCHHPGQPAPFSLLTYRDVSKRAKQIVDVTQNNYMPPWLPEPGFADFANNRRLTPDEKGRLAQWLEEGMPEGQSPAPTPPEFPEGWILGRPDLVVTMPEEYLLGPEGPDVYRNFVIPVTNSHDRYVRALEFSPGNSRIVHHAFIKIDAKRASRRLDAQDSEPGFSGMNVPAQMPNGQFLSWQPGKIPTLSPEGLNWLLPSNSDLILQAHLNRSGKSERLRSSIGLFFTNTPPNRSCVRALLTSLALDIPAGESNYIVTDSFTLPTGVQLLSVLPHAHYLAKEMQGFALLPDGSRKWLLWIKHWDFKWQGDYQYSQPVTLPAGATIHFRVTFDNTTNNLNNPNPVPKRVRYGPQSSDEMCELWFQMLPIRSEDAPVLTNAVNEHLQSAFRLAAEHRLSVNPQDAEAHVQLARILFTDGNRPAALQHLQEAVRINPDSDEAHYEMGVIFRFENRLPESKAELETALRLNANNSKAYGHLGFIYAGLGDAANAERSFQKCLELDPGDGLIQEALTELQQVSRNRSNR